MSQSSISSFFKRKDDTRTDYSPPLKRVRVHKSPERPKTPPRIPLSERTKHWHLESDVSSIPTSPAKQAVHEKFVERLGDYTQRQQQWREPDHVDPESDAEETHGLDPDQEQVIIDLSAKFTRSGHEPLSKPSKKNAATKLTPLEIQIQAIQEENPHTMLLVEVGYKYRFFGPDARTASQILGIAYFKSHSHLTASIPVHRLQFHVNRLVAAGHKVGVVRQIETAALKAIGDNRNKTFERKLCEVYSKGTYLGDSTTDVVGGWVLALVEGEEQTSEDDLFPPTSQGSVVTEPDGHTTADLADQKVRIGVVAIRAESGEVVYDEFDDGPLRAELEKRLLLLDVVEVIQVGRCSSSTGKIVNSSHRRIEQVLRVPTAGIEGKVKEFYTSRYSATEAEPVLAKILKLPEKVLICLLAQIQYMEEFSLESIFTLTNFFSTFEDKLCMQLPATTLAALEIFNNTTDGSEHGSLFWLLNNTRTLPGRRLLKKWIARPLVSMSELLARQEAVQELVEARGTAFSQCNKLRTMLKKLPDLDKGLSKIFYKKSTRPEILQTLQAFFRVSRTFDRREAFAFSSPMLRDALTSLSSICEIVDGFLAEFNHVEAAKDDKYNMFKESNSLDSISDHKMGILIIESDLRQHLQEIGSILKRKVVEFVTVAGIDFLIELKNDATKLVPKNWVKISGTKYVSRFHTPTIIKLVAERDQRKELLAIECDAAYMDFMTRISVHYDTLRWIVSSVAQLDCLLSLASVSGSTNYARPIMATGETSLELRDFRHPIIETILSSPYIPNTAHLQTSGLRTLIVSGPNMGGKSSFIKSIALIAIMAQIGCYVPCSSATMTILDGVYVRMGASDNMLTRESTFMVELHETSDIMHRATEKSLVILDELGRGTSTFDGLAIATSVLHHFLTQIKCLLVFVTHYPSLGEFGSLPNCEAMHMSYLAQESSVVFLYKLAKGMATRSYGLNVARLAGLEEAIVGRADIKAKLFEEDMQEREENAVVRRFEELLNEERPALTELDSLRDRISRA